MDGLGIGTLIMIIIILIIVLALVLLLIKCSKFILENKEVQEKKTLKIPIFGAFTSSLLIISILVILIRYSLPPIETKILFKSNNYYKETDSVEISQSIKAWWLNEPKMHFFRDYRESIPTWYSITFKDISKKIKTLKINFIYLIANENEQDILDKNRSKFSIDDFENDRFEISCNLNFDYKSTDIITIIYNIDIELKNEEIINIEEKAEYEKEIWRNNKRIASTTTHNTR